MIVRPAVDIREGQCVQLVGGSYDNELLRLPDPEAVAGDWITKGFVKLHVVDLDRATGKGNNIEVVREICKIGSENNDLDIRVGGGIRNTDSLVEVLDAGANSVVIGTQAIAEPNWFEEMVAQYPQRIYVALEVDGRDVKIKGWQETSEFSLEELIVRFDRLEIAGIFVTAIHKEGRMQGTDVELFESIVNRTSRSVVASGGVTDLSDIIALSQVGVAEVVMGAAIYTNEELLYELQANGLTSRKH